MKKRVLTLLWAIFSIAAALGQANPKHLSTGTKAIRQGVGIEKITAVSSHDRTTDDLIAAITPAGSLEICRGGSVTLSAQTGVD